MKLLTILIAWTLIVSPLTGLQAQTPTQFQTDILKFGRGSTSTAKQLIWDTGDGALNKMLSLNATSKEFTLNSKLNVTGAIAATGAISTTSGNISTASGNLSASGSVTATTADFSGVSRHQVGTTLGTGTNASKQITVDRASADTYLKWNETTGKWVFSNDGTVEKNMGSGSGGDSGINILLNPSWEDGSAVDWSNTGGTYTTATYGNPPTDDQIYFSFIASGAGQYIESTVHAIPTPVVGGCLAKFDYFTTDTANWKLQVYSGADLLSEQTLTAKDWQSGHTPFKCPVAGTNIKMRIISLAAGTILGDHAYLGKENRTFQTSQAKYYGSVTFGTDCSFSTASASFIDVTDATCTKTTAGSVTAASGDKYGVSLPVGSPAGNYYVIANYNLFLSVSGANQSIQTRLTDGTTNYVDNKMFSGSAVNHSAPASSAGNFIATSALLSAQEIKVQLKNNASSAIINNGADATARFDVYYYPSESQTALATSAQDWFIDVNIGGANPSLGTASVTSLLGIENVGLDLVTNTGSAAAKIPCSTTVAATGSTCASGAESVGVNFVAPTAGWYEACGAFNHYMIMGTNGAIQSVFEWVETTNATQTIIQQGKDKTQSYANVTSSTTAFVWPHKNCGVFYFAGAGEKTLRLFYEQSVSTPITTNALYMDRAAAIAAVDMHVIVRPLLSPYNRPYLTGDQLTVPGSTKDVVCSAKVSSTGVLSDQKGGCFTSCTNVTSPICTFAISWSGTPNCWHVSRNTAIANYTGFTDATTTTMVGHIYNTSGTATSGDRTYFCTGTKL